MWAGYLWRLSAVILNKNQRTLTTVNDITSVQLHPAWTRWDETCRHWPLMSMSRLFWFDSSMFVVEGDHPSYGPCIKKNLQQGQRTETKEAERMKAIKALDIVLVVHTHKAPFSFLWVALWFRDIINFHPSGFTPGGLRRLHCCCLLTNMERSSEVLSLSSPAMS